MTDFDPLDFDYSLPPLAGCCNWCHSPVLAGQQQADDGAVFWWCAKHYHEVQALISEEVETVPVGLNLDTDDNPADACWY